MATFVVEDGTGLTNANSYCSVAEADAYHSNNGNPAKWDDTHATGQVLISVQPSAGQNVIINGTTYTFVTNLLVNGNVLIGATLDDSIRNLVAAINNDGNNSVWYLAASANDYVTAAYSGTTVTLTAKVGGIAANAYSLSTTMTYPNKVATSTLVGGYALKEEALRIATSYLDLKYGRRWNERRTNQYQALDWPRSWISDGNYFPVNSNEIPKRIKEATAYLALAYINGDILMPDESAADRSIKSKTVKVGPITKSVDYGGSSKQSQKRYPKVDQLVAEFVTPPGKIWRA